ncbi:MAG: 1,4-dihydroxy-2-naphthoate polyprenyltransferase [Bacteroides sp.]|jgi:1,4-dihydroxy-2-naphthoate octaprenyltransferase|nr:1,4-dihydroxy-2-naphthoate polyprenyltransferase [Bacteroides sp.]MCI1680956.1 1,4-dihydroxy-2-naphthoate polyprenyltransferase [Bacteroides sp.]
MENIKQNSIHAWILAARPKTLTGAIIPVLIGSSVACSHGYFRLMPAILCLMFACGMQIAANFINDLYDFLKGTDREDRLGPERACAQGWITPRAMKKGIIFTVAVSCLFGCGLLPYGGWTLIIIGILCVVFAFLYTFFLSYHGWGDLLVLLFFGFVPVGGTYYVQALHLNTDAVIASLISGLAIDTLLIVNNYRDREQDAVSGKRTLIVRFGESFGSYFYLLTGCLASVLCLWFVTQGLFIAAILPQLYLYFHIRTWKRMIGIRSGKKLNSILGETSRNMLLLGIFLSIGLIIG